MNQAYNGIRMVFLCAIVFMMGGCAVLKEVVQKPTLSFERVSMTDMSLFKGTFVFEYKVSNPNPVGIPLDHIDYQVKINGKEFVKSTMDEAIHVPAKGETNIKLPIEITYLDFFDSLSNFVTQDKIEYELTGAIGKLGFNLPFQKKGTLDIPKIPKISMDRVEINNMSITGATLVFVLNIANSNSFSIPLKGLDYHITLAENRLAQGAVTQEESLKENSTSTLQIPVDLNFFKIGRAVYSLLSKDTADYELSGNLNFNAPGGGEKKFSYSTTGLVPFKNSSGSSGSN